MDVSVVLVSYNVRRFLVECLLSVKRETSSGYEIIVVDNGSEDRSAEMIRSEHPDVTLIQNKSNVGFARANNQAFHVSRGRYVFMLNPDTVILDGAIDKLVRFMDEHPDAGVCGPKNLGPDLSLQLNCHHFPSLSMAILQHLQLSRLFPKNSLFGREHMTYWRYDRIMEVDWITGCSLMIRKDSLDQCGLLDENYFLYTEECDLSYRLRKRGLKTYFVPAAAIVHYGGQSSLSQSSFTVHSGTITHYLYETRYYFFRKNYGITRELLLRFIDTLYFGAWLLKNMVFITNKDRKINMSEARAVLDVTLGRNR